MTRSTIIDAMFGLCPDTDRPQLEALTRELLDTRTAPGKEKRRFEGVKRRPIPGWDPTLLPFTQTILVTGGTGCVGRTVLRNLRKELPEARLLSYARRPPTAKQRVEGVAYFHGDVRDAENVADVVRDYQPDLIVHLAAQRDPSRAEVDVAETASTNITGTQNVLDAAGRYRTRRTVIASTGKAVRFFTSDVYAATKKVVEYQAALAARMYEIDVTCTRFTHVVDNSIVGTRIQNWVKHDEPILLHSPHIDLPVQSALECYHLLMTAGIVARDEPQLVALRDLGWPPINLLDMALDYLAERPESKSPIVFTGYPPGYEAHPYPGTYDPLTAGDVSTLINCLEATRTTAADVLGDWVDQARLTNGRSDDLDGLLKLIHAASSDDNELLGSLLREASLALLDHSLAQNDPVRVARIFKLGQRYKTFLSDHVLIHGCLAALVAENA